MGDWVYVRERLDNLFLKIRSSYLKKFIAYKKNSMPHMTRHP